MQKNTNILLNVSVFAEFGSVPLLVFPFVVEPEGIEPSSKQGTSVLSTCLVLS